MLLIRTCDHFAAWPSIPTQNGYNNKEFTVRHTWLPAMEWIKATRNHNVGNPLSKARRSVDHNKSSKPFSSLLWRADHQHYDSTCLPESQTQHSGLEDNRARKSNKHQLCVGGLALKGGLLTLWFERCSLSYASSSLLHDYSSWFFFVFDIRSHLVGASSATNVGASLRMASAVL